MTQKGTLIYQAPELSRGERYGFAVDTFSFALTMYELCNRVGLCCKVVIALRLLVFVSPHPKRSIRPLSHHQNLPYTSSERGKGIKLAIDVATEGKRPLLRETWNPAVSFLISSCWSNDAALRPHWGQILRSLDMILAGEHGLITASRERRASSMKKGASAAFDFAPGELWRRIETKASHINLGKVLGSG